MFYLENPEKFRLIRLEEMTDFYKTHYPPGQVVQDDFYELLDTMRDKKNSDVPSVATTGVYRRFLATKIYYNPIIAKRQGLTTSFYDFIQYEIDAWDQIQQNDFHTKHIEDLFFEMTKEPYFYLRHKKLYQFYAVGASYIKTESEVFNQVNLTIPKIREFVLENSWLNLQLEANF